MKHANGKPTYVDPVCGMLLSLESAPEEAVYKHRVYYFCAPACREAFEADPERYLHKHLKAGPDQHHEGTTS